jgi:hypothetical protein
MTEDALACLQAVLFQGFSDRSDLEVVIPPPLAQALGK